MLKILSLETAVLVKASIDALLTAVIRIHWRKHNYEVKRDVAMLVQITTYNSCL